VGNWLATDTGTGAGDSSLLLPEEGRGKGGDLSAGECGECGE